MHVVTLEKWLQIDATHSPKKALTTTCVDKYINTIYLLIIVGWYAYLQETIF